MRDGQRKTLVALDQFLESCQGERVLDGHQFHHGQTELFDDLGKHGVEVVERRVVGLRPEDFDRVLCAGFAEDHADVASTAPTLGTVADLVAESRFVVIGIGGKTSHLGKYVAKFVVEGESSRGDVGIVHRCKCIDETAFQDDRVAGGSHGATIDSTRGQHGKFDP